MGARQEAGVAGRIIGRFARFWVLACLCALVAACGTTGGGKYYEDDGPPRFKKGPDPSTVPDAVPRNEPLSRTGNSPYTALGKRYTPIRDARGYRTVGYASWYGRKYHGNRTSSGETYDMYAMTAAHPTLPLPTYVRVRNLDNGRSIVVKVNDRGPFLNDRVIDLSYMAARKLDVVRTGTARVEVEAVFPGSAPAPVTTERRVASSTNSLPVPVPVQTASAAPPVQMESSPNQVFVLQAGSFASRDNAERVVSRLRGGGYDNVRIEQVSVSGREYHRVQIGPYENRQSADLIASTIRDFLGAPVSVITMRAG